MLDWKILAASFAALMIVSTFLVGGSFGGGMFSDILNQINSWLGTSPFTGFMSSSKEGSKEAVILLYQDEISLKPDDPINLSLGDVFLEEFSGEINVNRKENEISLSGTSGFKIKTGLDDVKIEEVRLGRVVFDQIQFSVLTDDLDISADNGSIEISDFYGKVAFYGNYTEMSGNVSMIKGNRKQVV